MHGWPNTIDRHLWVICLWPWENTCWQATYPWVNNILFIIQIHKHWHIQGLSENVIIFTYHKKNIRCQVILTIVYIDWYWLIYRYVWRKSCATVSMQSNINYTVKWDTLVSMDLTLWWMTIWRYSKTDISLKSTIPDLPWIILKAKCWTIITFNVTFIWMNVYYTELCTYITIYLWTYKYVYTII